MFVCLLDQVNEKCNRNPLRVFGNRLLRTVFGPKREEVTGSGENYIMRSLMICTPRPILFERSNREE